MRTLLNITLKQFKKRDALKYTIFFKLKLKRIVLGLLQIRIS